MDFQNSFFQKRFIESLKVEGISQKQLASQLFIDPANITNWKKGKNVPSLDVLFNLCVILKVSSDYLLGLEDDCGQKIYKEEN